MKFFLLVISSWLKMNIKNITSVENCSRVGLAEVIKFVKKKFSLTKLQKQVGRKLLGNEAAAAHFNVVAC